MKIIEDNSKNDKVYNLINDYLRYHLPSGATYSSINKMKKIGRNKYRVEYDTDYRICIGTDSETGTPEYEYDTEYHVMIFELDSSESKIIGIKDEF